MTPHAGRLPTADAEFKILRNRAYAASGITWNYGNYGDVIPIDTKRGSLFSGDHMLMRHKVEPKEGKRSARSLKCAMDITSP
jgi:hypothetical protein